MKPLTEREKIALQAAATSRSRDEAAKKMGITFRPYMRMLEKIRLKGHEVPETGYQKAMKDLIPGQRRGRQV